MNLLNVTEEELVEDMNAKIVTRDIAHQEVLEAADRITERRRLVALQSQFGQISEDDIKQIREAQVLQAQAIQTEEVVKLN
jgi:hypothetical protein